MMSTGGEWIKDGRSDCVKVGEKTESGPTQTYSGSLYDETNIQTS